VPDPSPWTQGLSIYWRPELSFYEKRVDLLKAFEEQGVLRAFRVEENSVDAQLFASRDRLTVRQDGLDLRLLALGADQGRALDALDIALRSIRPRSPWRLSYTSQYIIGLDLDLEAAVGQAYGRLVGDLNDPSGGCFGDWAVLVDLEFGDFPSSGQVEFGLIAAEEAPGRLSRNAGRMGGSGRSDPDLWGGVEFPEVALFVDGRADQMLQQGSPDGSFVATARNFWNASAARLGELAEGLHSKLLTKDLRRVESG
jgi:hypothetical protein